MEKIRKWREEEEEKERSNVILGSRMRLSSG